jgi:hypothetical protein
MAFTVSFVIGRSRQFGECLSARLIGLFRYISPERLRKGTLPTNSSFYHAHFAGLVTYSRPCR